MNNPILAIVGPTASGKTELGLRLAKEQNGEIISVDSRQVYKHLSVGTAKPRGKWYVVRGKETYVVDEVSYHLVDILDPAKSFSAADFVHLATEKVAEIRSRGKNPIFVGGTGLYFKALTEGLAPLPPADHAVRSRLKKEAEDKGRKTLHKRLAAVDPKAAAKIPVNNIQRLIRALEVYELTGKPISQWHKEHSSRASSPAVSGRGSMDSPPVAAGNDVQLQFVGIDIDRAELIHRIEARCRTMIEEGMIEETQALLNRGYAEDCPALTGLGYPRIISMLKGTISKDDCLKLLIQDTRQYAKRQTTWFRHQLQVTWKK